MASAERVQLEGAKRLSYWYKTKTFSSLSELAPHLDDMFGATWGVSFHGHQTVRASGGRDYTAKELVFKFASEADRRRFTIWWTARKSATARGH